MTTEPLTDEQAREQAKRKVEIQRRALTLAEQLEQGAPLSRSELSTVAEALRIFARDQNESFALAELATKRIEQAGRRKCGWCVLVHGDALAESFPDNERCQAHVHGCEHNPLVIYANNLTADLEHTKRELARRDVDVAALRAQADAARNAIAAECVEHVALNGHLDIAEQCHDWLSARADNTGKMLDFTEALRVVIDQCDRQRRRANWYEAAYDAGKQKLIEHVVDKAMTAARDAARRFVALVDDLGALADDNDPRAMALAEPIGKAQHELWVALGLDVGAEVVRLYDDAANRCAVCGWLLAESSKEGCVRGNCSLRPRPERLYAPERAAKERGNG